VIGDKALSMLGMAQRAGAVASGEFMTERSIKDKKAILVIVATDASDNTKKEFNNMCSFYKVSILEYGTKEELGHAIGKEMRASIAVLNRGLADSIQKHINNSNNNGR